MLRELFLLSVAWVAGAQQSAAGAAQPGVSVEAHGPTVVARLAGSVLALSFAPDDHVVVLESDSVSFWKLTANTLIRQAEWTPPAVPDRVRRPGGLIHGDATAPDFWILRSGWAEAQLLTVENLRSNPHFSSSSTASVLPWPRSKNGLRFRPGTNLIEGSLDGLGPAPFVAVEADGRMAVSADGALRRSDAEAGGAGPPVGSAVARPWPDVAITSSPSVEAPDAFMAIGLDGVGRTTNLAAVPGLIRALAVLVNGETAILLASVDVIDGHEIVRLDLRRHGGWP